MVEPSTDAQPAQVETEGTSTGSAGRRHVPPILGCAYAVQGCVAGFGAFVVLPFAAARGLALEAQAGILSLASVPWVLKLLWAPWIDRWARGRHAAVLVNLLAAFAVAGGLALFLSGWSQGDAWLLAATWVAIQLALSLQDVGIDAIALDRVAPHLRGRASAWMSAGHHVGFHLLGGLAIGSLAARRGVIEAGGFSIGCVLVLASASFGLLVGRPGHAPRWSGWRWATISEALPRPSLWVLVVGALVADVATSTVSTELLVRELHWDPAELARVLPIPLLLANLVGFLVAGGLVDRLGHGNAAGLASAALGLVWMTFGVLRPCWSAMTFVVAIVGIQGIAAALLYVSMQAWMMDRADPRYRATTFAIWVVAFNLPRVFAPWIAPWVLWRLGWPGFFVVCGAYQVAYGAVFWRVCRGRGAGEGLAPRSHAPL